MVPVEVVPEVELAWNGQFLGEGRQSIDLAFQHCHKQRILALVILAHLRRGLGDNGMDFL